LKTQNAESQEKRLKSAVPTPKLFGTSRMPAYIGV
jgi:hypothetical protein